MVDEAPGEYSSKNHYNGNEGRYVAAAAAAAQDSRTVNLTVNSNQLTQ